jgi:diamine N-acetyltransferase
MQFRRATAADAPALAAFAAAAFWDTYREIDDPDDIAQYVAEHFNPSAISTLILDPKSTTLIAEVGTALAGYAVLSWSDAPECVTGPKPIELARFYLGKAFLGQGNGTKLMLAAHSEAARQGSGTVWLGVYDRNLRAINFYERFGFKNVGGKEFLFGGQIYIDPIYTAHVRHDAAQETPTK